MEFKAGDTVRLKSGGPLMTVEGAVASGHLRCQWFDEKKVLCHGSFAPAMLVADDGKMKTRVL